METLLEQAIEAKRQLYAVDRVGGPAHLVIDDGNLDDSAIEFCLKECDSDTWPRESREPARRLLKLLKELSPTKRRRVYITLI